MRPLRVYGWQGWRADVCEHGHHTTREIVAAPSMAAVGRIMGSSPRQLFNLCETGNAEEIATATAAPGAVFYRALNDYRAPWIRATEEDA